MSGTAQLRNALAGAPSGAAKPMNKYDFFRGKLEAAHHDLRAYLGSDKAVARFVSTCVSAVVERPDLLDADQRSLLSSCKKAAIDGLLPDGREAVLNIYSTKEKQGSKEIWVKKVQYLPMVAGIIKLIYAAGATYVDAAAVYEKDQFRFVRGDETRLTHEPYMGDDPGPIVAAYAVVKLADGEIKREVIFARDIAKIRAASKSADKGPWITWPDQMAIKSVLKRIRKQLPMTDERLDSAIANDNEALGFVAGQSGIGSMVHTESPAALPHDPSPTMQDVVGEQAIDQNGPLEAEQAAGLDAAGQKAPEQKAPEEYAPTFGEIADSLSAAADLDALDAAASLIPSIVGFAEQKKLNAIYKTRLHELTGE